MVGSGARCPSSLAVDTRTRHSGYPHVYEAVRSPDHPQLLGVGDGLAGGTTRRGNDTTGAAGAQSLNAAEASESSGRVAPSKVVVMGHTARSLSGDVIAVTGAACVTLPAQLVDARRSRRIIMVPRSTDRRTTSAIGEPRCNGHSGGSGVCQYIDEILQRTQRGLCQTPGGSVPPCSRQIFVWLGIGLDFQYQARQIIG